MTDVIETASVQSPTRTGAAPAKAGRDLTGTGYDRPQPTYDKALMQTGRGTPMGEYLRRYWHPIAIAKDVKDLPVRLRIMGEDLVVFRDKAGRPGVLYERCAHRQASLFYGRVEETGIRCCYHGWMFDVEGHCINQPLETNGGVCSVIRQPWYPVEELYGLVFIYMGPPSEMPLLPRYACMEPLDDDEYYDWTYESLPGSVSRILPTNWMINMDNIHDMGHALWLHELHSGPQFGPAFSYITMDNVAAHQKAYQYVENDYGIHSIDKVRFGDVVVTSVLETQMPNVRFIQPPVLPGPVRLIDWAVPVDDEHHYDISLVRVRKGGLNLSHNPVLHWDRSDPETVQRQPTDNEAQIGQGPIPWHSEEHLVGSDRGVVKMRRQYLAQLKALAEGRPLMNRRFGDEDPFIPTEAGAFYPEPVLKSVDPAIAAPSTPTVDLSGAWTLTMKTPMGEQTSAFTFAQDGSVLTGAMTGPDGAPTPLADGVVSGARATWKAEMKQPFPMTLDFAVDISGDALSGTFKPGVFPASEVTGRRVS